MHPESSAPHPSEVDALWTRATQGDQAAVARVVSLVEAAGPARDRIVEHAAAQIGQAHRIGISGPPGAGKSTLISKLARHYAAEGRRVGVVAVDPTSPRTGGALLGDRVRMNDLEQDEGVFIRSLATRGHGGGLSLATGLVADVMDALGFNPVLLETVGVGQSEVDVMRKAHTVVVLLLAGMGDTVQLMKAGLLEIADILVVNKADREGSAELATLLESEVQSRGIDPVDWPPPVLLTTAFKGEGVEELKATLTRHHAWLETSGLLRGRSLDSVRVQLRQLVERELLDRLWSDQGFGTVLDSAAGEVVDHRTNVVAAARQLADRLIRPSDGNPS